MTGLVPAMTRRMGIPSLFTLHNIHTVKLTLDHIEHAGIDTAEFWQHLYYTHPPGTYEQCRSSNPVDLLASGIFASHWVNTVSPSFLDEIVQGSHSSVPPETHSELKHKLEAGFASGVLNAPDSSYNATSDDALPHPYSPENAIEKKTKNKRVFQERMGLTLNKDAPLFFWPSRLDPIQKGPELLSNILSRLVSTYRDNGIQIALVADGEHAQYFRDIIAVENLHGTVSLRPFDENLSRLGFAASDFILMPSKFEPCGLTQMIALKYGSLPIVRNTGGLKDTVENLDASDSRGNGFLFEDYDSEGLMWGIRCAMDFHRLPSKTKKKEIQRIMQESISRFTHEQTASQYINLYEAMLGKPLNPQD